MDHGTALGMVGDEQLAVYTYVMDRVLHVRLDGELDIATAPRLDGAAHPPDVLGAICEVVLDLGGLRFCDAAGLNALLRLRKHHVAHGRWVQVANPTTAVRRVVRLAGLTHIFPV